MDLNYKTWDKKEIMSEFLNNLKKAVEEGEFNSEAAEKINEIDGLAEKKSQLSVEQLEELVTKRAEGEVKNTEAEVKTLSNDEKLEINSQYEKKMEGLKQLDMVNKQLATLIEIEDMVKASVGDMQGFIVELEEKFEKEFDKEVPVFGDLAQKIDSIKTEYKF